MKCLYRGPLTGLTLPDGREFLLQDGATVELPKDVPEVKTLLAMGRLTEAPAPEASDAKPASTKTEKGGK